jgi:sugar phosphate isomerase/epimerase
MVNRPRGDEEAQADELGNDPGQVGPDSGGQSGDSQQLSAIAEAADESVQELADSDQALEAGIVDGVEDAANHPERPVHTHMEYGRPDDLPPIDGSDETGLEEDGELEQGVSDRRMGIGDGEVDVEELPGDETTAA